MFYLPSNRNFYRILSCTVLFINSRLATLGISNAGPALGVYYEFVSCVYRKGNGVFITQKVKWSWIRNWIWRGNRSMGKGYKGRIFPDSSFHLYVVTVIKLQYKYRYLTTFYFSPLPTYFTTHPQPHQQPQQTLLHLNLLQNGLHISSNIHLPPQTTPHLLRPLSILPHPRLRDPIHRQGSPTPHPLILQLPIHARGRPVEGGTCEVVGFREGGYQGYRSG